MNSLGDTVLGLTYGQVRLVDSDPGWPRAFEALAPELRSALGELAVAIEHVGSTAVAGLLAKPILDLAVGWRQMPSLTASSQQSSGSGLCSGGQGRHRWAAVRGGPWVREP
jgi:GrpB-like predicted nucleotidyltransferase (UPF0157 family)